MGLQKKYLYDRLKQLAESEDYPFHMPGHKRNMRGRPMEELYRLDITEIDGFDNLHEPGGVLADIMTRASEFYGCRESFLLVNGSSCGVLSALLSAVPAGGRVLMARNSHKSAYHAVYLGRMRASYLYPEKVPGYGLAGGIFPERVEEALEREPDIRAVFLTSPTYDGVISDVRRIAELVHRRGLPLIVDEAHGAHLQLFDEYRTSGAAACGADLIVHSIHKTLPAPTQTALLHLNGPYADRERVRRYLGFFQSSSPSYLLMAGADECFRILETEGGWLAAKYRERMERFRQQAGRLVNLDIPGRATACMSNGKYGIYGLDESKILIFAKNPLINGKMLYEELRMKYHLQMEMCAGRYTLAMTSVMDTEEGFERLAAALAAMDGEYGALGGCGARALHCPEYEYPHGSRAVMTIYEAQNRETQSLPLTKCAGRTAAGYVSLYPPGIPVVVPGELYTDGILQFISGSLKQGLTVHGIYVNNSPDCNFDCVADRWELPVISGEAPD